ncbi:hypothetical protein ACJX0J_028636, partial [Zea mays]
FHTNMIQFHIMVYQITKHIPKICLLLPNVPLASQEKTLYQTTALPKYSLRPIRTKNISLEDEIYKSEVVQQLTLVCQYRDARYGENWWHLGTMKLLMLIDTDNNAFGYL